MLLYFNFITNSIKKNIIYRFNIWIKILGKIMYFFVQISVWKALFYSQTDIDSYNTLDNTIFYVTISNLISLIVEFNIIDLLNQKIREGSISTDLTKPFNYMGYIGCYGIGENVVNIFTQGIPLFLCAFFMINIPKIEMKMILFFVISLFWAIIINFLVSYVIGILAFFFTVTWPINMFLKAIYKLLSGVWIPIWLFPDALKAFNKYLPFQYIYYIPTSFLTTNNCKIYEGIIGQLVWCITLILAVTLIWKVGRKKMDIFGG